MLSTAGQFVLKPFKLWKGLRNVFPGAGGSGLWGVCTSGIACAGNCSVCEHSRGVGLILEKPQKEVSQWPPSRQGEARKDRQKAHRHRYRLQRG